MTISGREQDPSNDYEFDDPYILPVHLYRAPPPSYSEVAESKQQTTSSQEQLHGQINAAMVLDTETRNQGTTPSEAPPAYESVQTLST